jgi:hypothetical protein
MQNENVGANCPNFDGFFAALQAEQAQYIDIINRCIDECIGYSED